MKVSEVLPNVDKTIIVEEIPPSHGKPRTAKNSHRFDDLADYKAGTDPANLWVKYSIDSTFHNALKNKKNRDSYEDFVYGYLFYYDMVVKEAQVGGKHKLYFKWSQKFESVEIFISPAATITVIDEKEDEKMDSTLLNTAQQVIDPKPPPIPPPPEQHA